MSVVAAVRLQAICDPDTSNTALRKNNSIPAHDAPRQAEVTELQGILRRRDVTGKRIEFVGVEVVQSRALDQAFRPLDGSGRFVDVGWFDSSIFLTRRKQANLADISSN